MSDHDKIITLISQNIKRFGYHLYLIEGANYPRFAYSIGLTNIIGYELVFAGGYLVQSSELPNVFESAINMGKQTSSETVFSLDVSEQKIQFDLAEIDASWVEKLLLGAVDYFQGTSVKARQIVPCGEALTIDVPDMRLSIESSCSNCWDGIMDDTANGCWEEEAITNLDALRGYDVTECTRWEENWELFSGSGPDVTEDEIRVVPLGLLLAFDPSLAVVLDLEVRKGVWRNDRTSPWNTWEVNGGS